jgi:molybdopterin-guanine dinucleotide biosynthesis protein A
VSFAVFDSGTRRRHTTPLRLDGLVLAGGRSSRFGSDKRLALFEGEELVRRAIRTLGSVVSGTLFVATGRRRERLPGSARAVVLIDVPPGRGPLGGIAAALERSAHGLIVLGCDLPLVTPATLLRLARSGQAASRPAAVLAGNGWEPLVAYWPRGVYKHVRAALSAGRLAPHALLDALGTVPVCGVRPGELHNLNTTADLERAAAESMR